VILADTSIWIDFLGGKDARLGAFLDADRVAMHPFVVGEIALGSLRDREDTLLMLEELPTVVVAEDREVRELIERRRLFSRGIGYVDSHLIASALLERDLLVWTRDQRFANVASELGIGFAPTLN
jgi:hypothetical protein